MGPHLFRMKFKLLKHTTHGCSSSDFLSLFIFHYIKYFPYLLLFAQMVTLLTFLHFMCLFIYKPFPQPKIFFLSILTKSNPHNISRFNSRIISSCKSLWTTSFLPCLEDPFPVTNSLTDIHIAKSESVSLSLSHV